jgi:hypothetical protein
VAEEGVGGQGHPPDQEEREYQAVAVPIHAPLVVYNTGANCTTRCNLQHYYQAKAYMSIKKKQDIPNVFLKHIECHIFHGQQPNITIDISSFSTMKNKKDLTWFVGWSILKPQIRPKRERHDDLL